MGERVEPTMKNRLAGSLRNSESQRSVKEFAVSSPARNHISHARTRTHTNESNYLILAQRHAAQRAPKVGAHFLSASSSAPPPPPEVRRARLYISEIHSFWARQAAD